MPRYIDADKIHKLVDEKVAEGKDGWAKGVPYEWAYALTVIDMRPTADVVPMERYNRAMDGLKAVLEEREEDKVEVAMEIFEEIEELLRANKIYSGFAELKKKYK